MRRTVVNGRGQVTIPTELRKQLEIKPGTRITWIEEKGQLILARERHHEDSELTSDRGFEKKMAKAGKVMKRYRNTLRALAK